MLPRKSVKSDKLHTKKLSPRLRSLLLIWGLAAISCLIIFHPFLFGDKLVVFNDAGSDTRQQYLMQYATIVNHLKNGNLSLWDLNNGFGASMFSLNMTNVFLMLVYLAGFLFGVGRIPGVIVYLLILQIFLAATFCYLFLDCFSFSEGSKVTASYIYGLNGYLLVWGQHYQFGSFVVFLPLLLFLLERAVRRRKCSLSAPFLVAAMVCSSVYMSYMALLLAGFYLIYRMVLSDGSRRERIRQFFAHCGSLILGIGIGSFIFLPMVHYLLTVSSRLDSGQSFLGRLLEYLSLFHPNFYKTAFLRFFSTWFQGIGSYGGYSNFYEAPVLFFSALFVILALQYVFTIHRQEGPRKSKIMQYLAVLFFVFCMFIRIGASAFNAFAYPFSRHSFIFMPLFAVVTAYTLDQIRIKKRFSLPALLLACAAIAAAHLTAYKEVGEPELQKAVLVMACLALLMAALIAAARWIGSRQAQRGIAALLLLAVLANVSLEGYICYNDRDLLTTSDPEYWGGLYDPDVTEALEYLEQTDGSLYRVEKDYYSGSFCMDGMAQDYRGISAYNSTPNKNLEEFVNLVIPNFPIMAKYEYTYRQIGYYTGHSTLFGIKYLLSKDPALELSGFVLLKQFGDVYVYQNTQVSSIARFYTSAGDSAVLEDAYGSLDLERMLQETLLLDSEDVLTSEKTNEGLTAAASGEQNADESPADASGETLSDGYTWIDADALREEYVLEEIPLDIPDVTGDGSQDSLTIPLDQQLLSGYQRVYLEFDITTPQVTDVTVNPDDPLEYHFRVQANQTKHVQLAIPAAFQSVVLSRYGGSFQGTVSNIRLLGSKDSVSPSSEAEVTLTDSGNDSLLAGTVSTKQDGFLFLPVPYEEGWTAAVDGEEVSILKSDAGFMSIPVSAGDHTYVFTYRQPYMRQGVYISLLSLGVWILLAVFRKKKVKKAA